MLDQPTRRRIYEIIGQDPGICLREIKRKADLNIGTTVYHLQRLEKHELIKHVKSNGRSNYFQIPIGSNEDILGMSPKLRSFYEHLIGSGTYKRQEDIGNDLNMPHSSVCVNLAELERRKLIRRRRIGHSKVIVLDIEKLIEYERVYR